MRKFNPTPAERRWCKDTIARIADFIPSQYTGIVQERLRNKGIEVTTRYIIDVKNGNRNDPEVVQVLEQISRDHNRLPKVANREDIKRKKK